VSKRANRDAERPCQSKVCELEQVVPAIDQQVLRLQVAVEDAVRVAVGDAPQDLVEEGLQGEQRYICSGAARSLTECGYRGLNRKQGGAGTSID
jgi:hypothetical protein